MGVWLDFDTYVIHLWPSTSKPVLSLLVLCTLTSFSQNLISRGKFSNPSRWLDPRHLHHSARFHSVEYSDAPERISTTMLYSIPHEPVIHLTIIIAQNNIGMTISI
ncbi:MAG: hypothetical protein V4727_07260 [Verrucomicrobiota bacterium]